VIDKYYKFNWIRLLAADPDPRMTGGYKHILTMIALNNVKIYEDTFCVRQVTVADRCGTSERQVRRAFTAAKLLGYIELVQERQRGRTHIRADEYRLTVPVAMRIDLDAATEIPDNLSSIYGGDDPINTGHPRRNYRTPAPEIPDRADSPTSENDVPNGLNMVLDNGLEDPPSSSADCHACDDGVVLGDDGTPLTPTLICHHNGRWHVATPKEIREVDDAAS
jgi:hypothetical protein